MVVVSTSPNPRLESRCSLLGNRPAAAVAVGTGGNGAAQPKQLLPSGKNTWSRKKRRKFIDAFCPCEVIIWPPARCFFNFSIRSAGPRTHSHQSVARSGLWFVAATVS